MRVVGLDLSLTATGVAAVDGTTSVIKTKLRGPARLAAIRDAIFEIAFPSADLVVLEDYSFASRDAHAHELGELGGVVRLRLWELEVPYVCVSPSSLKKYACGRGNAKKDEVLVAAVRRLPEFDGDHNQADAAWLRAMALDALGTPVIPMPQEHRVALEKVEWPELAEA